MSESRPKPSKMAYSKPELRTYGDVGSMTRGSQSTGARDNSASSQPRTN